MDILDETQGKVIIWANYVADIKLIVERATPGLFR
jgi:hypothetical protein